MVMQVQNPGKKDKIIPGMMFADMVERVE